MDESRRASQRVTIGPRLVGARENENYVSSQLQQKRLQLRSSPFPSNRNRELAFPARLSVCPSVSRAAHLLCCCLLSLHSLSAQLAESHYLAALASVATDRQARSVRPCCATRPRAFGLLVAKCVIRQLRLDSSSSDTLLEALGSARLCLGASLSLPVGAIKDSSGGGGNSGRL